MKFSYDIKILEEAGWAALVAALTFIATQLTAVDPQGVTDWRAWALALAAGVGRVVIAAILNFVASRGGPA